MTTPTMQVAIENVITALDNLQHGTPELHLEAYRKAIADFKAAQARERALLDQDMLAWYARELDTPLAERYDGGNDVDLDL